MHALQIGGDDYLAKPFGMRELVARVEAALRRTGGRRWPAGQPRIEVPGLVIDPDLHRALLDGEDAGLTPDGVPAPAGAGLRAGAGALRDQLQQRVWGTPYRHRDRTVDVCVRKLRAKLDRRSPTYTYIQTHHSVGYRFEPTRKEPEALSGS